VVDPRELAPEGWHVATDEDWATLIEFLGSATASSKMKETGTGHWSATSPSVTNESGFTALPAGYRTEPFSDDSFWGLTYLTIFWTSTIDNEISAALFYAMSHNESTVSRSEVPLEMVSFFGYAVRCVKD
jgi:uncharacterized protein (TIGR02145 family)